jgi:pimeloyl-ACP methyl ester carboxylesterase
MSPDTLRGFPFTRAGLRLQAWESAGPEVASSHTLVFQHGLCGCVSQTAEAFPATDSQPRRMLTLDCRGHGTSELGAPADVGLATFADDLASFLDELIARGALQGPVAVGGISMGAALALRLAVIRPELVRSLLLVRPAWVTGPNPENIRPNAEVGTLLRQWLPAQARVRFDASDIARRLAVEAPDNLASLRGFFEREPVSATAELLCRISADGPGVTPAQLQALRLPVTLVGHERDVIHPWSHVQALAERMPHARVVAITPKATDKARYVQDLHQAIREHLAAH